MLNEIKCSAAQERAIIHNTGPMLVIAGPGSGKTFVITHRIQYLIEHHGVSPEQILVITFTKAAALEMQERTRRLLNEKGSGITFGTFHAVFYQILKNTYHYSAGALLRDEEKIRFLREQFYRLEIETEDMTELAANVLSDISCVKNSMTPIAQYEAASIDPEKFRTIFIAYQSYLKNGHRIDFDDMLCSCLQLFQTHPEIVRLWQEKYRYLLIDEFQDVNRVQFEAVRLLANPLHNLFIVGDDDQSIYAFRGASPSIMMEFEQVYPEAKKVILNMNYRSTKEIVESAGSLIAHNETRFQKKITTQKGSGEEVCIKEFETRQEELDVMIAYFRKHREKLSSMAVLVRTNGEAGYFAERLLEEDIPFTMKERIPDPYSHFVGEDLIAYCKMASGEMTREHFYKVCNRPKRYLSRNAVNDNDVSFERLQKFYANRPYMHDIIEKLSHDLNWIGRMRPYAAIHYILNGVGYEDFLNSYAAEHKLKPAELLERAAEIRERSRPYKSFAEWFDGIERYRQKLKEKGHKASQETGVTIATMHASKGLEYDTVFLPDVNEGIVPYRRAVLKDEIEEERRLFYVAMTRAKEKLFLYHVKLTHDKQTAPSRFLDEIKQTDYFSSSSASSSNSSSSR